MYPKVKVRPNEQDDCLSPPNNDTKLDLFSTSPESLPIQEKENSELPIARISRAYVLDSTIQLSSASKVENKRSRHVKDDKPQVRACSVPRPRAVLSSPNNDRMIGSRNKFINERRPILKPRNTEAKATSTDRTTIVPSLVKQEKRLPLKNNMAKASEREFKSRSDDQKKKIRKFQEPVVVVVKSQKVATKTSLRIGKPSV